MKSNKENCSDEMKNINKSEIKKAAADKKTKANENTADRKKTQKDELGFYKKLELTGKNKIWYFYLPIIFTIIAIALAIIDFEVQITTESSGDKSYKFYCGVTEVFHSDRYLGSAADDTASASEADVDTDTDTDTASISDTATDTDTLSDDAAANTGTDNNSAELIGDPNVISIIGTICMLLCLIVVPKSMLKKREHGDGLGLMFMPLGLMCINNIMCSFIYDKDIVITIIFSVICFIVSALATFKKTIKGVEISCGILMLAAIFLFLASFGPYCYNETVKFVLGDAGLEAWPIHQYFISYFFRDIFTFAAFGIFSSYISNTYKHDEINSKKNN